MKTGLLSKIKGSLVSGGTAPRAIKAGIFKGIRMHLDLGSQTQLYLGFFEREVYGDLKRLSAGIATAIDIGAASGEYTLYFLAKTGATTVLAFEPTDGVRLDMQANLDLNGLNSDRLKISTKFVGLEVNESWCTLDSLWSSISLPCLIKMDIDGGEVTVLEGAGRLLESTQVRWLIETHSPELERDCVRILEQNGYQTRIIKNAWWRAVMPEQRPIDHNRWLIAFKTSDNGKT